MKIETIAGTLEYFFDEVPAESWQIGTVVHAPQNGTQEIDFEFTSDEPAPLVRFVMNLFLPHKDIFSRWYPSPYMERNLPPNWKAPQISQLASDAPEMILLSQSGQNRLALAVSDALRTVSICCGVDEFKAAIQCRISCFIEPEAPLTYNKFTLYLDTRDVFYAEAAADMTRWFEKFYAPADVPPAAKDLLYSSWYTFHQRELSEQAVEKQCELGAPFGMKNVIVDDGWQSDGGGYSKCGDWQPFTGRFPNMAEHVKRVQSMGYKYILWYSVPFVGPNADVHERFKDKLLGTYCGAGVLDPRFPDVREYLISTYENAVKNWNLDGFKLDFIDSFKIWNGLDPAVAENYAGRDCLSVPEGTNKLMLEINRRLKALKPDILIEFRQRYTGPVMRQFGNMFRAGDCPADPLQNRTRVVDIRLAAGNSTVHADMLEWSLETTAADAAKQFLAILFAVPQISVRLDRIPQEHADMLKFWCGFWLEHRETLLDGSFRPMQPESHYPLIYAESGTERIAAVYIPGICIDLETDKPAYVANASGAGELIVAVKTARDGVVRDCCGKETAQIRLTPGLNRVQVPDSGLLFLA